MLVRAIRANSAIAHQWIHWDQNNTHRVLDFTHLQLSPATVDSGSTYADIYIYRCICQALNAATTYLPKPAATMLAWSAASVALLEKPLVIAPS
jgi:hypothetical protein